MGDYGVYLRDGAVMLYHLEKGELTNITERTDVSFQNKDFDRPVEKPTYGIGGWSSDGNWVYSTINMMFMPFSLKSEEVTKHDERYWQGRKYQLPPRAT